MAIRRKLIHFKTFENFNSQKLSANEENTKYTVGVGGSVTTGKPDIIYQSICWIKDTKQQWTHGELYDCDMGDVKPYVAFFTLYEIQQLAESGESRQCDQADYMGILDAVESGRPILISNGYAANGYATVVNKSIDDCIYLTVVGDSAGGVPRFYDVNVWEGEVLASEITYQQGIPEPYYFEHSASAIISAEYNGQYLRSTEEDYLNLYEAVKQLRPVVIKNDDGYPGGTCLVINQTCDDAVYLSVALGDPGQVELYELEVWADSVDIYKRSFQDKLVSGQNIKTVNGESLLGSGNVNVTPYIAPFVLSDVYCVLEDDETRSLSEQDYISLQNAVNSNVPIVIPNDIAASGYAYVIDKLMDDVLYLTIVDGYTNSNNKLRFIEVHVEYFGNEWRIFAYERTYQPNLVSGTNIKTINGESVLGSGNLNISDIYVTNFTLEEIVAANDSGEGRFQNAYLLDLMEAIKSQKTILVPNDSAANTGYATVVQSNYETQNIYVLGYISDTVRYFELYINYNSSSIEITELQFLKELVSGESIKTINNSSILGSGNLNVCKEPYIITNLTVSAIDNAIINTSGTNYFINIARPADLLDAIQERRLIYIPDTYGYLQPSRVTISNEYVVFDFTFIDTNDVSHIIRAYWDETYFDMYDFQTTGTITSVKMNGNTIAASGEVDLGNVASQDYVDNSISTSVTNTLNTEV